MWRRSRLIADQDLGASENGLDVIRRLRGRSDLPAILVTERPHRRLEEEAGAMDVVVLAKPVSAVKLRSSLLRAWSPLAASEADLEMTATHGPNDVQERAAK